MTTRFKFTENHIIFEDNHILIVDKPHRIPVTADESGDDNLEDAAKEFIKIRDAKPGKVYLTLCHRIDRPVRGLVLFAKTSKAASRLAGQIRMQTIKKTYYCYVESGRNPIKDTLIDFLKKDSRTNVSKVVSADDHDAKKCTMKYELDDSSTEKSAKLCRLKIELISGRSHQIRVQLSSRGMPILGDVKYGSKLSFSEGSIALFAYGLEFEHPTLKTPLTVCLAEIPLVT